MPKKKRSKRNSTPKRNLTDVRHFTKEALEAEPTITNRFWCVTIEKFTIRSHCALGFCGETKCPFYCNEEDQELFTRHMEETGKSYWSVKLKSRPGGKKRLEILS